MQICDNRGPVITRLAPALSRSASCKVNLLVSRTVRRSTRKSSALGADHSFPISCGQPTAIFVADAAA